MRWFKKKRLSEDFVELTIGKVYFKEITNGMLNKISTISYINGEINNSLFFQLFEYEIVDLTKKQIDNLIIPDGNKVREKLKEILYRYDILIKEEKIVEKEEANLFSERDVKWFNEQKSVMKNKVT